MKLIDTSVLGIVKCNPDALENKGYALGWNTVISVIENAPIIDAEPVRHGKWLHSYKCRTYLEPPEEVCKCSKCGFDYGYEAEPYNFCPNCGAKMDLGE